MFDNSTHPAVLFLSTKKGVYFSYANAKIAYARGPEAYLAAHLGRLKAGDYFAINAYVEMNEENQHELPAMRHAVRDAKRVVTTLGYGPRFLHSTGQLHLRVHLGPDVRAGLARLREIVQSVV